jgi:TonB family protein
MGAVMAIPLTLKVFKGGALVSAKDFERDIIKIGRLSSAHLRLEDEKVSRVHSVIEASADGTLSIIDMGSVEGTWVNGKRVTKGRVQFGDEIRLGDTTLRLESPAAVAAANLAVAVASTEVTPAAAPAVELASGLAQTAAVPVEAEPVSVAADPSLATTQEHEELAPVAEPAPRVRTVRHGKAKGPLGVSLCFLWGDQRVGEFFLAPGQKKAFSVGSAAGVDFVMGDARLGSPRMEVLRTDGQTFTVFFTEKMKGELVRKDEPRSLSAVIESGQASLEGEAYALTLEPEDFFHMDLGGITLEASFQPVPKRVHVPWADAVDYRALNIFLVMLFAGAMFVIGAAGRTGEDQEFADELNGDTQRLANLIIKQAEPQKNPFITKLNEQKARQEQRAQPQQTTERIKQPRQTPDKPPRQPRTKEDKLADARNLAQDLFKGGKGTGSVFGGMDLGKELKSATGNIISAVGSTGGGVGGLSTKSGPGGPGGPGGTGDTVGIGSVGTVGRKTGYGNNVGPLTGKESTEVAINSEPVFNGGTLDKELVRKVIQDHRSQIRTCYESLLNQFPNLGGKVQVQFTIGADGRVLVSRVAQSSASNGQLEQCVSSRVRLWQFPKPKGGGTVVVSYPFIFKQAGQ